MILLISTRVSTPAELVLLKTRRRDSLQPWLRRYRGAGAEYTISNNFAIDDRAHGAAQPDDDVIAL